MLEREGVVSDQRLFVLTSYLTRAARGDLKAGEYEFPAGASIAEVLAILRSGRAVYLSATDAEALAATEQVARTEGILIALETAHAFARLSTIAARERQRLGRAARLALCLSGRGDKDLATLRQHGRAGK